MGAAVLASRPPAEPLIGRIVLALIAAAATWIAAAHAITWLALVCGGVGTAAGFAAGRIIARRASIRVVDHTLVLELGREPGRIPLAELLALRFETSADSRLQITTSTTTIAVPSRVFAIGPRELDARLRELGPHDRWPDPLAPIEPIASWRAS